MKIVILIFLLLVMAIFWQKQELKKFEVTEYKVFSDKVKHKHTVAVLADVHGFSYGMGNEKLLKEIHLRKPEVILIAGDMVVCKEEKSYLMALKTLEQLVKIAPVYYVFGNHESRADLDSIRMRKEFQNYRTQVEKLGVKILRNETCFCSKQGEKYAIAGLEIDLHFYEKGKKVPMEKEYVTSCLGKKEEDYFYILLAHNPMYSRHYADWGAELTFCGHNHGGLIRFPYIGSVLSPQLTLFPKYNDGLYKIGEKSVIVSRGLGTHTFHIRIHNRAELVMAEICPTTE